MSVPHPQGGQKRVLDILKLKLWIVVSYRVHAKNRTYVLYMNKKLAKPLPLRHLSSPFATSLDCSVQTFVTENQEVHKNPLFQLLVCFLSHVSLDILLLKLILDLITCRFLQYRIDYWYKSIFFMTMTFWKL